MRNKATPEEIDKVLIELRALWLSQPHQRLGQLLLNLCSRASHVHTVDLLWNMDEDDILHAIKKWPT